jgi:hypothetical protein
MTGSALRIDTGQNADGLLTYVNTTSAARTVLAASSNAGAFALKGDGTVLILGKVGIGLVTPASRLHVQNGPSGWFPSDTDGIAGECSTSECVGVRGLSASGPGVLGWSHNSLQPGVRAIGAFGVWDLGLQVWGKAELAGVLSFTGGQGPGIYSLQLPNFAVPSGRGLANRWDTYSSRRWKTNIQTIQGALDSVERLRGVSFDWKQNGAHDIGLIAEEVGEVIPEIVTYEENGKDAKALDYARLAPLLVEAVKELKKENEALKSRLDKLESQYIGEQLEALESRVGK